MNHWIVAPIILPGLTAAFLVLVLWHNLAQQRIISIASTALLLALTVGLFTRFFAAALAVELLIAMMAAHWAKGFNVGQGGYEYVLFLGIACFFIAIRGGGPYLVDAKMAKEV